jgi:hypothetical protein
MQRATYNLVKEPTGETYCRLIRHLSSYCNEFLLVIRSSVNAYPSTIEGLEKFRDFLLRRSEEAKWPGTELLDGTATVYRFRLSPEALDHLSSLAEGLYSWKQPELPEDLCFIRFDGSPCLVSIAHEKDGYLLLSDEEYAQLIEEVPDVVPLISRG